MWHIVRRKRAADNDEGMTPNGIGGINNGLHQYVSDERITSFDSAGSPPKQPLHEDAKFPTQSGITELAANDLCRGAIEETDFYEECLKLTTTDTQDYIRSCVEDIKVMHGCLFKHGKLNIT